MAKAARAWQRMLSGRRLDLLDPSPLDIEIEDIAHGLAFVARWNGQTAGDHPFSVAEHSLVVERLFAALAPRSEPRWRLAALLHDAPEYVIGDMISPVKGAVGPDYAAMDARLAAAVHVRFGLPATLPAPVKALIKRADRISAWLEATSLAGFARPEADRLFGAPKPAELAAVALPLRPPMAVKADFLARHAALLAEC
ncbi:HD family hydrolase [Amaricoccus sp.]|uniref:HD domain-containing protein n=1 Tax=Amaricoccus sp. TaxID=1872485 RepID=UPI001B4E96CD|nr:HD family hydrolase [Amaricoccus sp.]MBP7000724.1 HD family hydrolase [Amaricoccus sp.]